MKKDREANNFIFLVLIVSLIIAMLVSFVIGRYDISVIDLVLGRTVDTAVSKVLINIRLPRIVLAVLVGGALSVAGCSFQTVFHNPMASPDILGASSGACFGAALAILLNMPHAMIILFSFVFGLSTIVLVYVINLFAKNRSIVNLLLAGIVVGSLFSAATSFVKLVADTDNALPQITYWLMGSLSGAKIDDMISALVILAVGTIPLMLLRWRMNFLTCPDEEATAMGINVGILRIVVIVCATLLTATCVSFSGMIGWVGLAVPHFCRFMVGNNLKKLLPASMLSGAIFLLIIDNISRNLLIVEIPIGILTAFVGAPFFIVMLIRGDRA